MVIAVAIILCAVLCRASLFGASGESSSDTDYTTSFQQLLLGASEFTVVQVIGREASEVCVVGHYQIELETSNRVTQNLVNEHLKKNGSTGEAMYAFFVHESNFVGFAKITSWRIYTPDNIENLENNAFSRSSCIPASKLVFRGAGPMDDGGVLKRLMPSKVRFETKE